MSAVDRFERLEPLFNNALLMAGILADRLEEMFGQAGTFDPDQTGPWRFGRHDVDRTLFAAGQALKMMEEATCAYQAALRLSPDQSQGRT